MIKSAYIKDDPKSSAYFVARNPYAWPGAYDILLLTHDGGLLCSKCVKGNFKSILDSCRTDCLDNWMPSGTYIASCNVDECQCDNCYKKFGMGVDS